MPLGFERDITEDSAIKFAKIFLDLVFAWSISCVVYLAATFAALVSSTSTTLSTFDQPDWVFAFITVVTTTVGAFVLGTIAKTTNMWILAALFGAPLIVFLPEYSYRDLAVGLIAIVCAIASGQNTRFKRNKAVLDIPWYHWLWIFSTSLFQSFCIPLTLLLAFIRLDEIYSHADARPLARLIIGVLFPLCILLVYNSCKILGHQGKITILERVALGLSWITLTVPQILLVVLQMGKDDMN